MSGRRVELPKAYADAELILFDGVCVLCNGLVDFVIRRDRARRFRYGTLQSDLGADVLRQLGFSEDELGTMILIERGIAYVKSTAALRIARRLSAAWPACYAFVVVPRPIRDRVYSWVGDNRYRWFGRSDVCRAPSPDERLLFIE